MKKYLILILMFAMGAAYAPAHAWMSVINVSGGVEAGESAFCTGSGDLFCYDGESANGLPTWDSTPTTEDCDGYDSDGDYCDEDTTSPLEGTKHAGFMGTIGFYEDLSSTATEWYVTLVMKTEDATSHYRYVRVITADANNDIVNLRGDSDDTILVYYDADAQNAEMDTPYTISDDTKYYIGIYYKEETDAGSDDGIVRVYISTSDSDFSAGEMEYNNTSADTGQLDAGEIRFYGPGAGEVYRFDNAKVVSGDPSWPTS